MKRKCYFYQFEDGYYCYTSGKLSKIDLDHETRKHGRLIKMEVQK